MLSRHLRLNHTRPRYGNFTFLSPVGTIDGSPPVHWRVIHTNPLWSPVGTIECPPISTVPTGLANGLALDYPPLKKRAMINRPYGTEWKCTVNFNVIALD
jgi:hypothetical protein